MTLTFNELSELNNIFTELQEQKLPFKVSLILAKIQMFLRKKWSFILNKKRNLL